MEKRTLKFRSLACMVQFSRLVSAGFLMNTNKLTLTGKFSDADVKLAITNYKATEIETTEKVYTY